MWSRPILTLLEDDVRSYENRHGVFEFRVAVCSNIDNIDFSDVWLPAYFGDSEVFYEEKLAWSKAESIEKEYGWTEYGIGLIENKNVFLDMTSKEAYEALDSYIESPSFFELGPDQEGHGGCSCCDGLRLDDLEDYE